MELYLVRHGQTLWNKEQRYYGHSDVGLSEKGLLQAKRMGHYFKNINFDKVIASPLIRAVDTAKELTDQEILTDSRLMEQNFGLFEGKTYAELKEQYPQELQAWNQNHENYCLPEGESFSMVRTRVEDFLQDMWKEEGRILVVAHKGSLGHLLAAMCKMPLSGYWNFVLEQGMYSKVDLEDGFAILRTVNRTPEKQE